jgi:hypothetical protein
LDSLDFSGEGDQDMDMGEIETDENDTNLKIDSVCSESLVKRISLSDRSKKILKYKSKLYKRRTVVPICKHFSGRSKIALNKNRVNGKFTKREIEVPV